MNSTIEYTDIAATEEAKALQLSTRGILVVVGTVIREEIMKHNLRIDQLSDVLLMHSNRISENEQAISMLQRQVQQLNGKSQVGGCAS